MRVLVACEFSGTVRRALRARGHDAWSCDLLPAEEIEGKLKDFKRRVRKTPMLISGATTKGVPEALKKLLEVIDTSRRGGRSADEPGVKTEEWRP